MIVKNLIPTIQVPKTAKLHSSKNSPINSSRLSARPTAPDFALALVPAALLVAVAPAPPVVLLDPPDAEANITALTKSTSFSTTTSPEADAVDALDACLFSFAGSTSARGAKAVSGPLMDE